MVIVQYSHTEDVDDDGLDDDVLTKPLSRVKFEHFETSLVLFGKTFLERGSSDVAVGLYHPWALSLNGSGDCIIPGLMSRMDLVTSVIENVVGLYHP